jgi:hypothetical protein
MARRCSGALVLPTPAPPPPRFSSPPSSPDNDAVIGPCAILGLKEILLYLLREGRDGQEIACPHDEPAEMMRQLLLEMLKEESWVEIVPGSGRSRQTGQTIGHLR